MADLMQDPITNFHVHEGLENQEKLGASSFASSYWANQGIDTALPFSTKQKIGEVWEPDSPEAEARRLEYIDGLNEEYAKSTIGVASEAFKQFGANMGATVLDTINVAVGSKALSDYVFTMRHDAQSRMAVYQDDAIRRNVIGAANSLGQLFSWRGAALGVGAAIGAIPGLQPVGAAIAASSLVPISLGFGLSTWSETYYNGTAMGLPEDVASNRAIAAAAVTGVSTFALSKYFDAGLASMLSNKNVGKAAELGFAKAIEVAKKTSIADSVAAGVKNYSVEVGQEFVELAGHLVNDKYWFDRDISASEIGMASTDIMLSMLMTIPAAQGIGGAYNKAMMPQMKPRSDTVITAANDSFHILRGQADKAKQAKDLSGVVDYIYNNNVDLEAVSEVLHQFVGPKDASMFNRQVAMKVRERQIAAEAVEQAAGVTQLHKESNEAFQQFENELEESLFPQIDVVTPVAIPEGVPFAKTGLERGMLDREAPRPVTPRTNSYSQSKEAEEAISGVTENERNAINAVLDETYEIAKQVKSETKKTKTSTAEAEGAPTVVPSSEEVVTKLLSYVKVKQENNPKAGTKALTNAITAIEAAETSEELAKAIDGAQRVIANEKKYIDGYAKYVVDASVTDTNALKMLTHIDETGKEVAVVGREMSQSQYLAFKSDFGDRDSITKTVRKYVNAVASRTFSGVKESVEDEVDKGIFDAESGFGIVTGGDIEVVSPLSDSILDKITEKIFKNLYTEVPVSKTEKGKKITEYLYVPKTPGMDEKTIASYVGPELKLGLEAFKSLADENFDGKDVTLDGIEALGLKSLNEFINRTPRDTKKGEKHKLSSYGLVQKKAMLEEAKAKLEAQEDMSKNLTRVENLEKSIKRDTDKLPLSQTLREKLYKDTIGEPLDVEVTEEAPVLEPDMQAAPAVETTEVATREAPANKGFSDDTVARINYLADGYSDYVDMRQDVKRNGNLDQTIATLEQKLGEGENAKADLEELRSLNRRIKEDFADLMAESKPHQITDGVERSVAEARAALTELAKAEGLDKSPQMRDIFHQVDDELRQIEEGSAQARSISNTSLRFAGKVMEDEAFQRLVRRVNKNGWLASRYMGGRALTTKVAGESMRVGEVDPATGQVRIYPEDIAIAAKRLGVGAQVLEVATAAHELGHARVPNMFKPEWKPGDASPVQMTAFMQQAWNDARRIPALRKLVRETEMLYRNDTGRVRDGSNIEALMGEELLMRIGDKMVARNAEAKQGKKQSTYGRAVLDPAAQTLWQRFKNFIKQGLLKSGVAKKFGLKFSENDYDFFAFKLMQDWLRAPDGVAKTKPGEIKRVYGGKVYDSLLDGSTLVDSETPTGALQSKILAPAIDALDTAYGADAKLDEVLMSVAEQVLGLSNSIGKEATIGEFVNEAKRILGEDLNILNESDSVLEVEAHLDEVFGRAVDQFQQYAETDKKAGEILKLKRSILRKVAAVRKRVPNANRYAVVDAIYKKMIPKGDVPVENLYDFTFNVVNTMAETEIARFAEGLHQQGITVTPAVSDAVRTVYEEDWNVGQGRPKDELVPLRILQRVEQIEGLGRRTKEEVLNDIDTVNGLLQRAEEGDESIMSRKDLYVVQKSLQYQLNRLHLGDVHVPQGSMEAFKMRGSYLWTNLLRHSSIESYMRKFGMPENVITAVKSSGSVKALTHDRMAVPLMEVSRAIKDTGDLAPIVQKHALLYSEGHPDYKNKVFPKLPENVQEAVKRVSPLVEKFYAEARNIIGNDYGGDLDFQAHQIRDMENKVFGLQKGIKRALSSGKTQKAAKLEARAKELYDRIALLKATNFVSISSKFTEQENMTDEFVARKTLTLFGLMQEKSKEFTPGFSVDDIHTTDILAEYVTSISNSAAMSNVALESKASNLVMRASKAERKNAPAGWVNGEQVHRAFNGYLVQEQLADTIVRNVRNPQPMFAGEAQVRRIFNLAKAKEFINPAVMLSYDSIQGMLLGVVPGVGVKSAWDAIDNLDQDYVDLVHLAGFARPNVVPGSEMLRRRAATGSEFIGRSAGEFAQSQIAGMLVSKNAIRSVRDWNMAQGAVDFLSENFVTAAYSVSREYAWKLDSACRLAGYKQLLKRGYSKEHAAKMVARTYVDYADMPTKTRRVATMVAFTPVYAFESMLAIGRNMQDAAGVMKNIRNGKASSADMQLAVKSLVSLVVLNGAAEALMQMSGYDRDEDKWWDQVVIGRKFKKKVVTKDGLEQELHVRLGGPLTVFAREIDRMMRITDVDNLWELPQSTYRSLSTLQHPIFRNAMNLINLEDRRGDPIWNEHDPMATKYAKATKTFLTDWVPMLGWAMSSDNGIVSDDAREAALGNWYSMGGKVINMLYFPYLTDPHNLRIAKKIDYQRALYMKAVRQLYEETGTADPRVLEGLKVNFEEAVEDLQGQLE